MGTSSGSNSMLGTVAGLGVGAGLAAFTGGASLLAGAAIGAAIGGTMGGQRDSQIAAKKATKATRQETARQQGIIAEEKANELEARKKQIDEQRNQTIIGSQATRGSNRKGIKAVIGDEDESEGGLS